MPIMVGSAVHFPRGRYYALTWGIPDAYGGMTRTMLHRSRAFRRLGGVEVEILTIDDRPDYAELSDRLLAAGELVDGLRIRNLWDDLRARPPKAARHAPEPVAPLVPAEGDLVVAHGGVVLLRERRDRDGGLIGADRFRRDGTILATERVVDGRRSIVLYDEAGRPLRRWRSRWALYRWWLDRVFGGRLSFLLIDSKTTARFIPDYRRENVVTVHIVHASHRARPDAPQLRPSREDVLRRCGDFDALVVLTERQRLDLLDDLTALGIDVDARILVIPNGVDLPAVDPTAHARGEGVVVASLDDRKRVEHAVDAAVEARALGERVALDIYGDGERAQTIRALVQERRAEASVELHGYRPDARSRFREADFSLLTSTSEGLPLVLVESMAAGCIPIAYDIRYGPADIIRDGVDGFVVPEGDPRRIAERIVQLQRMPAARVQRMRRCAMSRSREFSDLAVARRWARELQRALDAKRIRDAAEEPLRIRLRRRAGVVRRRVRRFAGR